jgi:hypothetical protein
MSYFIPNWRAGMANVSAAIDQNFGERLTLIACLARPNFPTEPDASIKPVTLSGVFSYRARLALDTGHGRGGQHGSGGLVQSQDPIATFSHAALPWLPQRGDRIRREADGTTFEVTATKSDGVAHVTLDLVDLGRAEL